MMQIEWKTLQGTDAFSFQKGEREAFPRTYTKGGL